MLNSFKVISKFQVCRSLFKWDLRFYCDGKAECMSVPEKKGLVLGVYMGPNGEPILTPAACRFNEKIKGKLMELILSAGNCMHLGTAKLFNNIEPEFWSIAVAGLGKQNPGYNHLEALDMDRESVRLAAGAGAQLLHRAQVGHIFVEGLGKPEQAAEGTSLALWRYQEHRQKSNRKVVPTIELFDDPDHDSWQRGLFKSEAQNLVRFLTEKPANFLTPTAFAHAAVNALCPCGVKVDIHDKDWMETQKMKLTLAAARGSCEPPCFVEISYCGGPPEQKPIILIGKGTCFDTGGLCLKTCKNMLRFRADMCGAAIVVGVIRACSMLSLPLNVTGVLPLIENLPSGQAYRCGDVIHALNNISVELEDTSHEGHAMFADSFVYSQRKLKPRLMISVSASSHETRQLLGSGATGCFSNSEYMWRQIRKAGIITGDRVWRLPLWNYYLKRCTTDYTNVDVNNNGKGLGKPCISASFYTKFIDCVDWLHMDVEGTGKVCENYIYPYLTKGMMTGRPTRTILQLIYQLACPNPCDRP